MKYLASVSETVTHTFVVEADSRDEAESRAYDMLVVNGMTPDEETACSYSLDSDGIGSIEIHNIPE